MIMTSNAPSLGNFSQLKKACLKLFTIDAFQSHTHRMELYTSRESPDVGLGQSPLIECV